MTEMGTSESNTPNERNGAVAFSPLPTVAPPTDARTQEILDALQAVRDELQAFRDEVRDGFETSWKEDVQQDIEMERGSIRSEFGSLRGSIRSEFGSLRGSIRSEFGSLRESTRSEFGSLRESTRSEFGSLRESTRSEFGSLRESLRKLEGQCEGSRRRWATMMQNSQSHSLGRSHLRLCLNRNRDPLPEIAPEDKLIDVPSLSVDALTVYLEYYSLLAGGTDEARRERLQKCLTGYD